MSEHQAQSEEPERRDAEQRHRLLEEITAGAHPVGDLYQQSSDQLQAILDASPAVIYAKELYGRFILVNREFLTLFGVRREDVYGKTDYDLLPSNMADEIRRNDLDVASSGLSIEREEIAPQRDGVHTYLSLKFPLHDPAGAINAVCGISMDITERKRAEDAVHRSERDLRALAETVPQLVWIIGPTGEPEYVNKRWTEYTGLTPDESHRLGLAGQIEPSDLQPTLDAWAASLASGTPFEAEYRLRGADGSFRWFLARGVPVRDDSGQILRWFGTSTDIDDRRRGEAAQRLLADLGQRMHSASDPDGLLREVVDAVGEHLGLTRCSYGEIDPAGDTVTISPGYRLGALPTVAGTYPLEAFGPAIVAGLRQGRTAIVRDVETDPRTQGDLGPAYAQVSSCAFVSVPVVNDGHWVSVLIASMDGVTRDWTADEVALLETVAERTWLAVENVRLYRAERVASLQRQQFLKDVMASVTDGRLVLCLSADELPLPLAPWREPVPLTRQSGLQQLRHRTQGAAESLGFAVERWYDLVTAVSEAGMNAIVHAGGGEGRVYAGTGRVQVWITDTGLGIEMGHLPQAALRRGYTTAGTLGHGLKMVLQTADKVFLLTGPEGTTLVMEQNLAAPPQDW